MVLGIDSSSNSIAYSVFIVSDGEVSLQDFGKIEYEKKAGMDEKIRSIRNAVATLFTLYPKISKVVIEQTVYIQNPQTSRILSYIVGAIWSACAYYCNDISDVSVQKWKAYIGYKNVSSQEKKEWEERLGKTEAKKKAAFERKERTARIMRSKFAQVAELYDDDIMDAVAIGYWASMH